MHFTPDTDEALAFAVALANTVPGATKSGVDELQNQTQLTELLVLHRYTGRFDRDDAELDDVRETRTRIRHLWSLSRDDAALQVNRMLRDAGALPQIVRHDGFDWHLHATQPDAPLAERIRVEVSMAIIDVIRSDQTTRLRACAAPDCDGILADFSRNGSKQFCGIRCGNRMNMIAFRERASSDDEG